MGVPVGLEFTHVHVPLLQQLIHLLLILVYQDYTPLLILFVFKLLDFSLRFFRLCPY